MKWAGMKRNMVWAVLVTDSERRAEGAQRQAAPGASASAITGVRRPKKAFVAEAHRDIEPLKVGVWKGQVGSAQDSKTRRGGAGSAAGEALGCPLAQRGPGGAPRGVSEAWAEFGKQGGAG